MKDTTPEMVALAAEPHWVEVSREELFRRQCALGALMTKLANRPHPILTDEESELLESLWQMHVDLLG